MTKDKMGLRFPPRKVKVRPGESVDLTMVKEWEMGKKPDSTVPERMTRVTFGVDLTMELTITYPTVIPMLTEDEVRTQALKAILEYSKTDKAILSLVRHVFPNKKEVEIRREVRVGARADRMSAHRPMLGIATAKVIPIQVKLVITKDNVTRAVEHVKPEKEEYNNEN